MLVSSLGVGVPASGAETVQPSTLDPGGSWLDLVNDYRAMAGLPSVVEEPTWSDGLAKHLTYLQKTPANLKTGAYASAHTENPASPWYTPEGDTAGRSADLYIGNVSNDRVAIQAWMAAPFHAIGLLRSRLQRVAYARTSAGAALDVIRGVTGPANRQPVLWPGAGSQVDLTQAGPESPDPLDSCPGFKRPAGLPIIAMLPSDPPAGTTARLRRPDGTTVAEGARPVRHHGGDVPIVGPDVRSRRPGRAHLRPRRRDHPPLAPHHRGVRRRPRAPGPDHPELVVLRRGRCGHPAVDGTPGPLQRHRPGAGTRHPRRHRRVDAAP